MNTLELLQIYMHRKTKTIQLSHSVCFDLFLEDSKGQICTKMCSFFTWSNTKPIVWLAAKKQNNYYLLSYVAENEHTLFYETFFGYEKETDVNNVMKKSSALKKLLFKTIIVFTSIYFESYCKIPARSNKSIL